MLTSGQSKGLSALTPWDLPMLTNPAVAEIVNATTPITVNAPPYEQAAATTKKVATGILDTVADFVEENKTWVYVGIGMLGFLAIWRKK